MKAILFDNYDGYDFEEIKSDLSKMYPDTEITDDMVWDEINNLEDIDGNKDRYEYEQYGYKRVSLQVRISTPTGRNERIVA